ncbi:hypothetical protein ACHAW6_012756 [Cyclotella cf. meneghiniana]
MKLSIALVLSLALVQATQQSDQGVIHRQVRRNDTGEPSKLKKLDRTGDDKGDENETQTKEKEMTHKETKKHKHSSANVVETETVTKEKEAKEEKGSKKETSPTDDSSTVSQKEKKKEKIDTKTAQLDIVSINVADIVPGGDKQKDKKREEKKNKNSQEPEDVATVEQVEETTPTPATAASVGRGGGRGEHTGKKHVGRGRNGGGRKYKLDGGVAFQSGKSDKTMDEFASFRKKKRAGNRNSTTNRGAGKIGMSAVEAEDYKKKTTSVDKTTTQRGHRMGGRTAAYDAKSAKS